MSKPDHTSSPTAAHGGSPWLTVPEAAAHARSGRDAIYNACRTGALKARQSVTPHGKWLIHIDDLDAFLAGAVA